jgi:hypothetical protein
MQHPRTSLRMVSGLLQLLLLLPRQQQLLPRLLRLRASANRHAAMWCAAAAA